MKWCPKSLTLLHGLTKKSTTTMLIHTVPPCLLKILTTFHPLLYKQRRIWITQFCHGMASIIIIWSKNFSSSKILNIEQNILYNIVLSYIIYIVIARIKYVSNLNDHSSGYRICKLLRYLIHSILDTSVFM